MVTKKPNKNPIPSSLRHKMMRPELQGTNMELDKIRGNKIANKQIAKPILADIGMSLAPKKGAIVTMGSTLASVKKKNEKKYSGVCANIWRYLSNNSQLAPPMKKVCKNVIGVLHDNLSKP
jgi:hypothetical protein